MSSIFRIPEHLNHVAENFCVTFVMLIEAYLIVKLIFATLLTFLTKSQPKTVHGPDFHFHGKVKFDIKLHYAEIQIT